MAITLLIPVYNRAHVLRAVWPSYAIQTGISAAVLVNDASTDETASLLEEIAASSPFPVTIKTHTERRGQQASRITAISEAKTPWVLFGEDDVWLTPGYAETLLRQASESGASAIAGRIINFKVGQDLRPEELVDNYNQSPTEPVFNVRRLTQACELRPSEPIEAPFLHTIALIDRAVLNEVTFDVGYRGNSIREETDFYLSMNASGHKVMFTGDALCYHLRGPICGTGGHRMNRLVHEYWSWRNTWRLIYKHRRVLKEKYNVRGVPLGMFLAWAWNQSRYVIGRTLRREGSSFR